MAAVLVGHYLLSLFLPDHRENTTARVAAASESALAEDCGGIECASVAQQFSLISFPFLLLLILAITKL